MFRSPYLDRDSVIHGLDPRTKLISLILLSVILFAFNHPLYVATVAAGVLAISALAQCLPLIGRLRKVYLILFGVNFLVWQLTTQGSSTLVQVGPLRLTSEGLLYGAGASMRFVVVLTVSLIFISCTSMEDFSVGLVKLRVPYPLAFVVSTTMRLLPTFVNSASTVLEAQSARGLVATSRNPLVRFRQLLPVLVPLVMYALRHAAQMSLALEARGFSSKGPRTSYSELRFTRRDLVTLAVLTVLAVLCVALRLAGYGSVMPGRL